MPCEKGTSGRERISGLDPWLHSIQASLNCQSFFGVLGNNQTVVGFGVIFL